MTQGKIPEALCPVPGSGSQLGCREAEFPLIPRHQGGFGSAEPGPSRRVRDTAGSTSPEVCSAPKGSAHHRTIAQGCPRRQAGAPGPAPGEHPRRGRAARPERPLSLGEKVPPRGRCPQLHPRRGPARLSPALRGSAPAPAARGGSKPRGRDGRFVRVLISTRSFPSSHFTLV